VLAKTHPEFAGDGTVPYPVDDVTLLTIAREFATRAAPLAADFGAHGIPLGELDALINGLDRALNDRAMQRDAKVRARARMDASFERALHAVATLDVNVANHLGKDPVALAVWKGDRRLWSARRVRIDAKAAAAPSSPAAVKTAGPVVAVAATQAA
jgi:hypothetical protein